MKGIHFVKKINSYVYSIELDWLNTFTFKELY